MESMFVWIVIFAFAAVALLGVFLVASERELKKKRKEVELLMSKLSEAPAEAATPTVAVMPAADVHELIELRAKNQKLEKELGAAQGKLATSRRAIEELEADQRRIDATQSNAQWLQTANDQLKAEIENLKTELQTSEARIHSTASQSQDTTQHQRALEAEVTELHQKLADSMTKNRQFEGLQQQLANLESSAATQHQEKHQLEVKISQLNQELSSRSERLREFDDLRQRFTESERTRQTLEEKQRSIDREISKWQARVADADQDRRRLAALQEPFDQLAAKHAAMEERQREHQQAWASFSHLVNGSNVSAKPTPPFYEVHGRAAVIETRAADQTDTGAAEPTIVIPERVVAAVGSGKNPKRRFGIFPAMIVLAVLGALAMGLRKNQTEEPSMPAVTASVLPARPEHKAAAEAKALVANSAPAASGPAAVATLRTRAETKPAVKANNSPAQPVQTGAAGTYETVQASRVYAAPSELSQQLGDIEPGTRVTVVKAKNGWLEIHSKYGRPPGFIRKEAARVATKN